jgi:hypothetical protein
MGELDPAASMSRVRLGSGARRFDEATRGLGGALRFVDRYFQGYHRAHYCVCHVSGAVTASVLRSDLVRINQIGRATTSFRVSKLSCRRVRRGCTQWPSRPTPSLDTFPVQIHASASGAFEVEAKTHLLR